MQRKTLYLATRNAHKVRELQSMLSGTFWDVRSLADVPHAPEVAETGDTFLANANLKAEAISLCVPEHYVLADDSGLEVDALHGAPGVWSARYAGLPSNDANNNAKLLKELEGKAERTARFQCVLALARAGNVLSNFRGTCEGHIIDQPNGANGFGYDPLFIPEGHSETFGQLPDSVKAQISHRARALAQFVEWSRAMESENDVMLDFTKQ